MMSAITGWAHSDGDCIGGSPGSNPSPVIAMFWQKLRSPWGDGEWPGRQLSRVSPPMETSDLGNPSPRIEVNLQVKHCS